MEGETRKMRILNRMMEQPYPVIDSFALDELLGRQAGAGGPSVCHLWRHPRAFVIGAKDRRLPGAANAMQWLTKLGYDVIVRNSGGAAVPLDQGVVNLSLIQPLEPINRQEYRIDFERMYALIRQALSEYGCIVDRGEVKGSYCPGDYDLHIDGLKFCGIAQRRQVKSMIIQAFIIVEGSGAERAERVKAFYERAGRGAEPGDYPLVQPNVMTSLQERAVAQLDGAQQFAETIIRTLQKLQLVPEHFDSEEDRRLLIPEQALIEDMGRQLRLRYR